MEVGTSAVTEGDLVPMGYMNDLVLGEYMYFIKQEAISLLRLFVIHRDLPPPGSGDRWMFRYMLVLVGLHVACP